MYLGAKLKRQVAASIIVTARIILQVYNVALSFKRRLNQTTRYANYSNKVQGNQDTEKANERNNDEVTRKGTWTIRKQPRDADGNE